MGGDQGYKNICVMEWRFKSANDLTRFDKCGVLYALGTSFGKLPYANPVDIGAVEVRFSHDAGNFHSKTAGFQINEMKQSAAIVVTHEHPGGGDAQWSRGAPDAWIVIDLKGRLLKLTHYCYRGDCSGSNSFPRTWEMQGSCDGTNWTTLRRHEDDSSVSRTQVGSWPIEGSPGAFSQFRVLNRGTPLRLCCSGIELYGAVAEAPRQAGAAEEVVDRPLSARSVESLGKSLSARRLHRAKSRMVDSDSDTAPGAKKAPPDPTPPAILGS